MHASQAASLSRGHAVSAPRLSAGWIELSVLFIALILFSGGVLPRLVASEQTAEGSPILRLVWLPIYALTLAAMIWRAGGVIRTAMRLPFLIALMGLALISFLWSIDPALSQRRGVAIFMTCAAGLFIGAHYDWNTLLRLFGLTWLTVAALSFLTALLVPSFGVMDEIHVGAWKGLYYEKNQLGGNMARSALLFGFLALMDKPWRKLWVGALLLAIALVIASTSKTSLLGLVLGLGTLAIAAWMKRSLITGLATLWAGALIAGAFAALLVFAPELVFGALGRDPSLTGRTEIWTALTQSISERPWFGYGYGSFWAADSEPAYWVRDVLQWDAPTAHNGWLDVALSVGLVGLALLILDFLMTLWRAVRLSIKAWTGVFALGVCAQFLLFSFSESISLQQNDLIWITYVAIAAKLASSGPSASRSSAPQPMDAG